MSAAPSVSIAGTPAPAATLEDYNRAAKFVHGEAASLNNDLVTTWLPSGDQLWYRRAIDGGSEYVLVDVVRRSKAPAFDHERMADALGKALGKPLKAADLPIQSLVYEKGRARPIIVAAGKRFDCDLAQPVCTPAAPAPAPSDLVSPDGRHSLFVRDYNLWVRDQTTGAEHALTTDGAKDLAWSKLAIPMEVTMARRGSVNPPSGVFSPDGRYFFTHRLDERNVGMMHIVQHVPEDGTVRPKEYSYRYALPGEPLPQSEMAIFDLTTGRRVQVDTPSQSTPYLSPAMMGMLSWRGDSSKAYLLTNSDDYRTLAMREIDPSTGKARLLISEESPIFFLPSETQFDQSLPRALKNGDFIWASDRSGYRHIYLYDGKTLKLKNAITSGAWEVRQILRVDESAGEIYFEAIGKDADPYFRAIYRVKLDGTGLKRLTMEVADHQVTLAGARRMPPALGGPPIPPERAGFSPNGAYFVDNYATPEKPGVAVVRDLRGKPVMTLETATLSAALKPIYRPAEMFKATAADGKTAIFGTIFKPSTFDSAKAYPVIDVIYPGPQIVQTSKRFLSAYNQSLAELGFIVVTLDGRGTPLRSRDFLATAYHNMGSAGHLDDHVAAIRELAASRPYMDINRVGIWGGSGGGFATARAMADYSDFFKVGVAAAGNHDQRALSATWAPVYHGPFDNADYETITSFKNIKNLKGKLLIVHGEMDEHVIPSNSYRLIDALIKNNKTFDMLMLPNVNHAFTTPYFTRRLWDYFVVNLQGGTPPPDFAL